MYSQQAPPIAPNPQLLQGLQPGTNVIIIPGYGQPSQPYTKYKGLLSKILGIVQICLGVISIILNAVMIALRVSSLAFVASGIWCGIFYLIAGGFGIASQRGIRCLVITHMVMSIIAASFATIPFGIFIAAAADRYLDYWRTPAEEAIAFSTVLVLVSLAEIVVAILASVICCKVACGNDAEQPQNYVTGGGGVQYVVTTGESNQMLLQPAQCQPQASGSAPTNQSTTPPPKYEEKTPLA